MLKKMFSYIKNDTVIMTMFITAATLSIIVSIIRICIAIAGGDL